jgi:4-hydroxybenzoate polyprenyltransferase
MPVMGGCLVLLSYLIGLTTLSKAEAMLASQGRRTVPRRVFWSLLFLGAPLFYGVPVLLHGGGGALLYLGFLAWAVYAISFLRPLLHARSAEPDTLRVDMSRSIVSLIAGISLLDALLMAGQGALHAAGLGVLGFGLTLVAQRYIRGT